MKYTDLRSIHRARKAGCPLFFPGRDIVSATAVLESHGIRARRYKEFYNGTEVVL